MSISVNRDDIGSVLCSVKKSKYMLRSAQTSKQQLKQTCYTLPSLMGNLSRSQQCYALLHLPVSHTTTREMSAPYSLRHQVELVFAIRANSASNSLCPLLLRQQNSFQIIWWGLEEAELIELIRSLMRSWQAEATVTDWIRCKTACRQWICYTAAS